MNNFQDITPKDMKQPKVVKDEYADSKKEQQISVINNQGKVDSDVSNSWATTISQYLSQRRIQTKVAYQAQLQSNNIYDGDSEPQNGLFDAIFEILIQRLEEGHTVLVLNDSKQNIGSSSKLYRWQQQLLHPLLQSLLVPTNGIIAAIDFEILENKALWETLLLQTTLSEYEQQILRQRYSICISLYHYFQYVYEQSEDIIDSLSIFIKTIEKTQLFEIVNIKNEIINNPIVFQIEKSLKNNDVSKKNISITLWLHRTWQAEYDLARHIIRIKQQTINELPIVLSPLLNAEQKAAIHMANRSAFSIITGGPGTGKTFTVAQLVIALQQTQNNNEIGIVSSHANLALAAPTGKAAQRMQESLQDAIQLAGVTMQLPEAKTIHRLLGIGQGGRPRYNTANPLSEDVIIVDEASMLGVEMANYLVSAIKPNARLILLGDANQLAAVDAGAVLADLCRIPVLQDIHKRLDVSRRFTAESGIGKLAHLINSSVTDMPAVWQLMQDEETLNFYQLSNNFSAEHLSERDIAITNDDAINTFSTLKVLKILLEEYSHYIDHSKKILIETNTLKSPSTTQYMTYFKELMTLLNSFKVLTAGHNGRCGDHYINRYLSEQHKEQLKLPLSKSPWYHGRPVMILQNNYELGLFNGDIGICLQTERGRLQVFFENKTQGIAVNMFSDDMIATAYAMTIHKSQGSEFEHVAISFDDNNSRLLSQELIYTAVTRAKKQVTIFSTTSALTRALSTPTVRQTGLGLQFANLNSVTE